MLPKPSSENEVSNSIDSALEIVKKMKFHNTEKINDVVIGLVMKNNYGKVNGKDVCEIANDRLAKGSN
jgi:Asp-tRNA(Asn)/Glu-tRNA(Gln) amidotransferase B subunit